MTNYEKLFFNSTKGIVENAKNLRQNQTEAEQKLWYYLRNRKLDGFKFRRQHYIRHYIADFYCAEKMLSIELDGGIHNTKEAIEYDRSRTEYLNQLGIKEIRFKNEDILSNIYSVLDKITAALNDCNNLTPDPSPYGEGKTNNVGQG